MQQEKKKKIIFASIILFTLVCIVVVVLAITNSVSKIGKTKITFFYAPFSAEVRLDNMVYKNNSDYYIEPGNYILSVSQEGFKPIVQEITITNEEETFFGSLEPDSELGEKIQEEHEDDFNQIEPYIAELMAEEGDREREVFPIINELPIKNLLYKIGYSIDLEDNLVIYIHSSETYLNDAIEKLSSIEENPEKLNIVFQEYKTSIELNNPFKNLSYIKSSTPEQTISSYLNNAPVSSSLYSGVTEGNYHYTKFTTGSETQSNLVTYKVILKNNGGLWEIISSPSPILTIYNTSGVSEEILHKTNKF